MGVFNSIGKISQYGQSYLDNRLELVKLEITEVVSAVFSKVLNLVLIAVVGISIYLTSMLIILLLLANYFTSYVIAASILLAFHVILLLILLWVNNAYIINFFKRLLLKEFTDIKQDGETNTLSAKEYKQVIITANQMTTEHIKNEFKSMFFIDKLEKRKAEETEPTTYTNDEELIYEEMKNAFTNIISSKEKGESTK